MPGINCVWQYQDKFFPTIPENYIVSSCPYVGFQKIPKSRQYRIASIMPIGVVYILEVV